MKREKFLCLIGIIFLFFFGIPIRLGENSSADEILFKAFILKFNKSYNDTEYKIRFKNFKTSLNKIAELNNNRPDNDSALYGVTEYSDLLQEEFFEKKLQKSIKQFHHKHSRHKNYTEERTRREILPLKVDWREKGVVGKVYDQKTCGACWAFSTIQTVESMNAIKTGMFVDLSVQQVIDCARYGNYGCEGGDPCSLLNWLISTKTKIITQKLYPFTYKTGVCKAKMPKMGIQIKSFTCEDLAGAENQLLQDLAYHGPVAAVVNAINWQYYLGGIIQFHCSNGLDDMNHAVEIVGYDKSGPVPYYIAKNSWGPEFGNKGYVYIAIGKNMCGLANQVVSVDLV